MILPQSLFSQFLFFHQGASETVRRNEVGGEIHLKMSRLEVTENRTTSMATLAHVAVDTPFA
jgi:hypothetical protein